MYLPALSESKTANGKGQAVEDGTVQEAQEVVLVSNFREGENDSEGKVDPSKDHDGASGSSSKRVQDQDTEKQKSVFLKDTVGIGHTSLDNG